MKTRVKQLGLAAMLSVIFQGAWAQGNAWYIAGGLGASFVNDVDATDNTGITLTADLDTGIFGTGAVGRSFGNFRAEGEFTYNVNDVSSLSVAGVGGVTANGDVSTMALMVNGYYDFSTNSKWKPFIGGGIGTANVSINNLSAVGIQIADDDAWTFAYQLKVGVAYAFTNALAGTLGYRFFGTTDADYVDSAGDPFSTDGTQAHMFEIGVRYRF